jgi:S1-C subfamily serine protease
MAPAVTPSQNIFFGIVLIPLIFLGHVSVLKAEESAIQTVMEKAKAIVSIQSLNATVLNEKPQAALDRASGQILVAQRVRPVGYARSGGGMIIDSQGIVVTNAHTVRDAGGINVTLFDGTKVRGNLIHILPDSDLAFLYIDPPFALTSVDLANSDAVSAGANVYTIGHSQWLKGSLVGGKIAGIVQDKSGGTAHTAVLRVSFEAYQGDSGSPVFDSKGSLLGMVTAGMAGRENGTFAIASNVIAVAYQSYLKELKQNRVN